MDEVKFEYHTWVRETNFALLPYPFVPSNLSTIVLISKYGNKLTLDFEPSMIRY